MTDFASINDTEDFGDISIHFKRQRRFQGGSVVSDHVNLDRTGFLIWPEARLLADYFVRERRREKEREVKEEREECVVELGCGVGLCGILWALLHRTSSHSSSLSLPHSSQSPPSPSPNKIHLFLTDGNEDTLQTAEENLLLNLPANCEGNMFSKTLLLLWGSPLPSSLLSLSSPVKLVFGAGLVYPGQSVSSISSLFLTVRSLFSFSFHSPLTSPQSFLLSYLQRSEKTSFDLLHTAHTHGFQWEKIEMEESHSAGSILLQFTFRDTSCEGEEEKERNGESEKGGEEECDFCEMSCLSLFPPLSPSLLNRATELKKEEEREEEEFLSHFADDWKHTFLFMRRKNAMNTLSFWLNF